MFHIFLEFWACFTSFYIWPGRRQAGAVAPALYGIIPGRPSLSCQGAVRGL
jgi:hypothetical protein